MNLRRLAFALLALAGAASCETGGRFPPSDMSFEQFCPRWHARVLELYQSCQDVPPEAVSGGDPCVVDAARIAAGRIAFDRSVATGCLREWEGATCTQFQRFDFPACDGLESGRVDVGGACDAHDECDGGYCDREGACPGKCRSDVIAKDGDCSAAPRSCASRTTCVATDKGMRCRPRVDVGGACGPGVGDCFTDLTCAAAAPGAAPTCLRTRFPGETCDPAAPVCVDYATCGAGGTCVRDPALNEPCGQLGDRYVTCVNAWCDGAPGGAPGTCRSLLAAGAACVGDDQCAGTALCTGGVCAAPTCP